MPIDPSAAIGAHVGTTEFSWTSSDVLLYHLGIGAGSRPASRAPTSAPRSWTAGRSRGAITASCCRSCPRPSSPSICPDST